MVYEWDRNSACTYMNYLQLCQNSYFIFGRNGMQLIVIIVRMVSYFRWWKIMEMIFN